MALDGEVVIPKNVRDYLRLEGGNEVEFVMNSDGEIVVRKAPRTRPRNRNPNRFHEALGSAEIKFGSTAAVMRYLRGDDEGGEQ
jgi:AbrB family looped-hinge helix DNA binding protein